MSNLKALGITTICVALGILLSACSTPPVVAPTPVQAKAEVPPMPAPPVQKPVMAEPVKTVIIPAYLDPNNPIATQRSVYFDFDAYLVKESYTALIERQGKYLASNPALSIKIEGNTDERGGAEYNLALGQKRAEAVRKALAVYGVKDAQMEAVSWGKQKPQASGHDEAAWAQNRRADIVYPGK